MPPFMYLGFEGHYCEDGKKLSSCQPLSEPEKKLQIISGEISVLAASPSTIVDALRQGLVSEVMVGPFPRNYNTFKSTAQNYH